MTVAERGQPVQFETRDAREDAQAFKFFDALAVALVMLTGAVLVLNTAEGAPAGVEKILRAVAAAIAASRTAPWVAECVSHAPPS